jgi:hypothetical protein
MQIYVCAMEKEKKISEKITFLKFLNEMKYRRRQNIFFENPHMWLLLSVSAYHNNMWKPRSSDITAFSIMQIPFYAARCFFYFSLTFIANSRLDVCTCKMENGLCSMDGGIVKIMLTLKGVLCSHKFLPFFRDSFSRFNAHYLTLICSA